MNLGKYLVEQILKEDTPKYTVYFDVDNTLTNYSDRLRSMNLRPNDTVKDENIEFWSKAEWLPLSKEMLNFSKKYFSTKLLTAAPDYNAPKNGKLEWVKNNIGDIETIFTRRGTEKSKYASPTSILIDDSLENIRAFTKAGGIGILFENNPEEIIQQLLNYLNPDGINEMSQVAIQSVEDYADKELAPLDIEFTKHFFDRLIDPRNIKPITSAELIGFFKRLSRKKVQLIDFLKKYKEIVAVDNRTNINIPLVQQANSAIAKTIMRKKDFKTPDPKIELNEIKPITHEDIKKILKRVSDDKEAMSLIFDEDYINTNLSLSPEDCNNGLCDIWAKKFKEEYPEAEMWDTEQTYGETHGHVWVKYGNKFYDAEIPDGVLDWKQIPYMKRYYEIMGEYPQDVKKLTENQILKKYLPDYVNEDMIPGGLAQNKTLEDIVKHHNVSLKHIINQLKKGIQIELEHTQDEKVAEEIAMDHLWEDPDYYDKLEKIESPDSNNSDVDKYISYINKVFEDCCEDLNITPPELVIITDDSFVKENHSFGGYIPGENKIYLVITNRVCSDACRTLTHELKHAQQDQQGILTPESGQDGSEHENECNSYSGKRMREFNRTYPEILTLTI